MATTLTRAQVEGVRASAAYLAAFLRSEVGRGATPSIDTRKYAGVTRDGRPLAEALQSPLIGVRAALKDGKPPQVALNLGLIRAKRTVGFETMQAARDALIATVKADDRFSDFQRAVAGTCAACEALSGTGGPHFEVHPNCECVPMPVVRGVRDLFPIPTGIELFKRKTKAEQDAAVGPEAAQLIRDGQADLKDFISHSKTDTDQPDFLTQKPVDQVAT